MSRNPDSNFVLHGRNTPVSFERPREYLTNSQRTISTRNLSQSTRNGMGGRDSGRLSFQSSRQLRQTSGRDPHYQGLSASTAGSVFDAESLFGSMNGGTAARQERRQQRQQQRERAGTLDSQFSLDLTGLGNSLGKSVSFSKNLEQPQQWVDGRPDQEREEEEEEGLEDTFEEELQRLINSDILENERIEQDLAGKPRGAFESQWFTSPTHLTRSADYPVFESLGVTAARTSPVGRTAGMLGAELAQRKLANQTLLCADGGDSQAEAARLFFPATLGEMASISRTVTPQPADPAARRAARARASARAILGKAASASRPSSASRADNLRLSHRSTGRHSAYADPLPGARHDYDYLRASEPFVDQGVTATPFQYELAQLKMERLRLEEQHFLEAKRQEELERIRGPTPKWYELKTPKFTYELHKNNKLLESREDWQKLMDYRDQLTKSSSDFSRTRLSGNSFR